MKTDVIAITANGTGFENVLEETERAAAYRGLAPKQALRLRLLAEEMTGMLRTLIGDEPFRYWVESEGTAFSLHLETQTIVTRELRKALLKTSSSGKNAAAILDPSSGGNGSKLNTPKPIDSRAVEIKNTASMNAAAPVFVAFIFISLIK